MSVVPIRPTRVAITPELPGVDAEEIELLEPVKCGRCRLSFVQHPSIVPGDSARWWVCPPCRDRLLGKRSRPNTR
jgi:hypothetical protein